MGLQRANSGPGEPDGEQAVGGGKATADRMAGREACPAYKERAMKKILSGPVFILTMLVMSCGIRAASANQVRYNLEVEEQNFRVFRRVVFYNGITGEYILSLEGYLAIIVDRDGDLVVTVKTGDGLFLKHYLGLSDNVTYFSEALQPNVVSDMQYKVIFKPISIVPTIELQ